MSTSVAPSGLAMKSIRRVQSDPAAGHDTAFTFIVGSG